MSCRHLPHLFFCAALLTACSASHRDVTVRHEPAPNVNVPAYRSYHLVVTPTAQANSTHWMVEKAIHDDLRAKGYVPVDRAAADLVVTYETDIANKSSIDTSHSLDGSMASRKSMDKHIAITLVDARRQQPVWRGTAQGEVHPGRLTASVEEALAEILAGIPRRS